jgi:hypothetical protein
MQALVALLYGAPDAHTAALAAIVLADLSRDPMGLPPDVVAQATAILEQLAQSGVPADTQAQLIASLRTLAGAVMPAGF